MHVGRPPALFPATTVDLGRRGQVQDQLGAGGDVGDVGEKLVHCYGMDGLTSGSQGKS